MKTLKLCLPILLSVALLGCNNEAVATNTQTISVQKVTPANVAKPKPTTLKQNDDSEVQLVESVTEPVEEVTEVVTPKKSASSSNAALKDVIIDGHGNLVVAKADGSFMSYAPIKGDKGDKGDQGAQGVQGERGADGKDGINGVDGKDGKDGRGIDHCELTDTKDLVIYYTDGTSQNVGNLTVTAPSEPVTPPVDDTPEYEKVGYKLVSNLPNVISVNSLEYDYTISNYSVELKEVNNNNPSNKYKYFYSYDYTVSEPYISMCFGIALYLDNHEVKSDHANYVATAHNGTMSGYIYSSVPYVEITEFRNSPW